MRRHSDSRRRGNVIVEFALSSAVLFPILFGVFQFGYAYYQYNNLETAVRNAARYGAVQTISGTSLPSTLQTSVRNMVIYGSPSASGDTPKICNVNASDIVVTLLWSNGVPSEIEVKVRAYSLDAVIKTFTVRDKPLVRFPYVGRFAPPLA